MITAKEFAARHDVAYTTVLFWLKNDLVTGAEKTPLPFGSKYVYLIPENAPKPDLKPGPKTGESANDQIDGTAPADAKPKRRASKRAPAKKAMNRGVKN